MAVQILFKRLHPAAILPQFKTAGASGADLYSVEDMEIPAGQVKIVKLGFAVAIPRGYEIQVRPRSGLAGKHQVTVLNTPGTIDSDFRGEMMVILANLGAHSFFVCKGDRIAQAVVGQVPESQYLEVEELDETGRGAGMLGSTGRN